MGHLEPRGSVQKGRRYIRCVVTRAFLDRRGNLNSLRVKFKVCEQKILTLASFKSLLDDSMSNKNIIIVTIVSAERRKEINERKKEPQQTNRFYAIRSHRVPVTLSRWSVHLVESLPSLYLPICGNSSASDVPCPLPLESGDVI